uniref:Integrase core domain-containing protein n=1 Tax=Candidatus Kentrum sp. TUN TaxID=2126343 RepID=A0A451AD51_9GAMM|nr:MAG: Integrase core domain-containing protein [Candidatus Kentron sp. TUN]
MYYSFPRSIKIREYRSSPPSQVVPRLADKRVYIASESSFYRVLHEANQLNCRGRTKAPGTVAKPKGYKAEAPNETWSWDITYLASAVRGSFYYLYMAEDIYSRKIVGWEIHERQNAEYASGLIRKGYLAEGIRRKGLVLHSDNGGPMRGATMLATLHKLGIVPSFSRPSVSDTQARIQPCWRKGTNFTRLQRQAILNAGQAKPEIGNGSMRSGSIRPGRSAPGNKKFVSYLEHCRTSLLTNTDPIATMTYTL